MAGRITHIKRVYQNDNPDSDAWVDIERIDELDLDIAGQRVNYVFDWKPYDAPVMVGIQKKTLVDPNDSTTTIDVPVRDKHRIQFPQQIYDHYFLNGRDNKTRETHSRRIYHHAIKEAYLVGNEPPSNPRFYRDSLGEQETEQYIDVEVIDAYHTQQDDNNNQYQHFQDLFRGIPFRNQIVRDQVREWSGITDDPLVKDPLVPGDVAGGQPAFVQEKNPTAGPKIDPPWRLDPLQNIVNVHWGGLAVIFGPKDSDAPE